MTLGLTGLAGWLAATAAIRRRRTGTSVAVIRSLVIDAAADKVWALLASPEAWSLRPGANYAFDLTPAARSHRHRVEMLVRPEG